MIDRKHRLNKFSEVKLQKKPRLSTKSQISSPASGDCSVQDRDLGQSIPWRGFKYHRLNLNFRLCLAHVSPMPSGEWTGLMGVVTDMTKTSFSLATPQDATTDIQYYFIHRYLGYCNLPPEEGRWYLLVERYVPKYAFKIFSKTYWH